MRPRVLAPFALAAALGSLPASARANPLWQAEIRAGYGLAASGAGQQMSTRTTPLTLAAIASVAVDEEPPLAGYGGLTVETLDRNAVGTLFGITFAPHGSRLRASAGGVYLFAPYTLWGATASIGPCLRLAARTGLCGDLQLTAYFAGSDLPDGGTVTQGQLVVALVFDGP